MFADVTNGSVGCLLTDFQGPCWMAFSGSERSVLRCLSFGASLEARLLPFSPLRTACPSPSAAWVSDFRGNPIAAPRRHGLLFPLARGQACSSVPGPLPQVCAEENAWSRRPVSVASPSAGHSRLPEGREWSRLLRFFSQGSPHTLRGAGRHSLVSGKAAHSGGSRACYSS